MPRKKQPIRKRRSSGLQKARNAIRNAIPVAVIVDTREKDPWTFEGELPSNLYIKQIYSDKLEAGDYCIIGYELDSDDYGLVIERKASLEEFINNLGKGWDRFKLELEKMSKYHTSVIIIEDDLSKAFSRYKSRSGYGKYFNVSPNFIIKRISEIQTEYGVSTYFMSTKYMAQRLACSLFKDVIKLDEALDDY
ncbi:MAG: ERCC4 domain-containing protein [Nitrospinae bacterium]|nr:ERCC4 domain-containing protein [Nitrospinota bacterium]